MSLINIGGITINGRALGIQTWPWNTATSGTDTTDVANTLYFASVYAPGQTLVTAINYLAGSVGGTDLAYGCIFDISGNLLANSAAAGTTVGTAAQITTLPLTVPKLLDGPNFYLIGLCFNGATAHLRTIPAYCGTGLSGTVSQTFATGPASIVVPATAFTANTGPLAYLS